MIGRVVSTDYTFSDDFDDNRDLGVLVRLSARMEDGSRWNGYVRGTEPYFFVPEDESIPQRDYIKRTESGFESLFDDELRKVVTETPEQVESLLTSFLGQARAMFPIIEELLFRTV